MRMTLGVNNAVGVDNSTIYRYFPVLAIIVIT